MTLKELMTGYVLPAMAEKQSDFSNYAETYEGVGNMVLNEIWEQNARLRAQKGLPDLGEFVPFGSGDELPFDYGLLVNCAVWGIALGLRVDEAGEDGAMLGYFQDKYQEGREKYNVARYREVKSLITI